MAFPDIQYARSVDYVASGRGDNPPAESTDAMEEHTPAMAACTDALSRSWSHAIRLTFQPFRLVFWLKATLLVFLIQGISLLNFHLDYEALMDSNYETWVEEAMRQMPVLVTLLGIYFILAILFDFLYAVSRFLFYDGIAQGMVTYFISFHRLLPQIVAFFLWYFIVKALFVFMAGLGFVVMVLAAWMLSAAFEQTTALILIISLNVLLLTILGVFVAFYLVMLNSMVAPLMAILKLGIFAAWRISLRLALENMGEFLGYAFFRFLIVLGYAFLLFWISLIVGILSFGLYKPSFNPLELGVSRVVLLWLISLPFDFFLTWILLPVPVWQNAYALSFMAQLTGAEELEPHGGETDIKKPEFEEPIPGAGPSEAIRTAFTDIPISPGNSSSTGETNEAPPSGGSILFPPPPPGA
ncbi:MAG TPA: hypothetical protein PLH79_03590 [bacterium]|nr:hypothetical protein [Candidatus Omnitrophota bacterium]HOL93408.1 hypothetical protein [bacterium]HXK95766.1 hypothetical protein [bacterium]